MERWIEIELFLVFEFDSDSSNATYRINWSTVDEHTPFCITLPETLRKNCNKIFNPLSRTSIANLFSSKKKQKPTKTDDVPGLMEFINSKSVVINGEKWTGSDNVLLKRLWPLYKVIPKTREASHYHPSSYNVTGRGVYSHHTFLIFLSRATSVLLPSVSRRTIVLTCAKSPFDLVSTIPTLMVSECVTK